MDRRAFIGSLALATLAAPRVILARPARNVHRIGILGLGVTSELVGPQPRSPSIKHLVPGAAPVAVLWDRSTILDSRRWS